MRSRTIGETSSISVVAEGVAISFRYDRKSVHSARVREEKSKHAPFMIYASELLGSNALI